MEVEKILRRETKKDQQKEERKEKEMNFFSFDD